MAINQFTTSTLVVANLLPLIFVANELVAAPPVNRARPPKFSKSAEDAFFPDAHKQLVGPRPTSRQAPAESSPAKAASVATEISPAGQKWSALISPEVIEDEIKAQQLRLGEAVSSPARFKAGEYQNARAHLAMLAVLFAIDAEHDEPMRWRREAPAMRDALAHAARSSSVASSEAFSEAQARSQDLEGLIRGNPAAMSRSAQSWDWSKSPQRESLMKRLEQAQKGLTGLEARGGNRARNAEQWSREAQLIAALAEVIDRQEQEASEAKAYREHAAAMRTNAVALREAIERKNAEQMRTSLMGISKACDDCHAEFRD